MKVKVFRKLMGIGFKAVFPALFLMGACAGTPFPLVAVEVNPLCASVALGGTQQFNATIFVNDVIQAPNPDNSAVIWSILGGGVNGTISNNAGSEGLYQAPATQPPDIEFVTVMALFKTANPEDEQKQGQASVFLDQPCPTVPPITMSF